MDILNKREVEVLEMKLAAAETLTSAELKIIIIPSAYFGLKRAAKRLFRKHKLHDTKQRNAVLFLIAKKDREFLVYGDEGISQKVKDDFWLLLRNQMELGFKTGSLKNVLSEAMHTMAAELSSHFPAAENNENEISNEIIFEK